MNKKSILIRISIIDWKRIKEIARKDKRTMLGAVSFMIDFYLKEKVK